MSQKNKKQWNLIGLFLATILASALAVMNFYQRDVWDGILFAVLAVKGLASLPALMRECKAGHDGVDAQNEMESTGNFAGNVLFAFGMFFLAVFCMSAPDLRRKSLVTCIFALLIAVYLLAQLPVHFRRYKQYREYKKYCD